MNRKSETNDKKNGKISRKSAAITDKSAAKSTGKSTGNTSRKLDSAPRESKDAESLLIRFREGEIGLEEARRGLRELHIQDLGFAQIDLHRELRSGFPEVIYGEGKTPQQILGIAERLLEHSNRLLVTRAAPEAFELLSSRFSFLNYHAAARCIHWDGGRDAAKASHKLLRGHALVICAGTTDIPVAEEAALTASLMGCEVRRLYDVGVAGIHRLLNRARDLSEASVIIVCAGMEGALPSVVGGLVEVPVIAVPTAVGYGASFGGLAALLGMLNSCASGVTVVNIGNGFGAGFAAAQILRLANRLGKTPAKTPAEMSAEKFAVAEAPAKRPRSHIARR